MPVVFAATIFTTSALPGPGLDRAIRLSDKLLHMTLYGGMALIIAIALQRPGRAITWRRALLAALLSTLYGILEEYHQSIVPGRVAAPDDILANAAGAFIVAGWYLVAARRWPNISLILGS